MSTILQSALPSLEEYAGKWVAVRDDEIIASADTLEQLRDDPEVRRDDAVFVVPERGAYFY